MDRPKQYNYKEFVDMTKEFDLLVFIGRFQPFHREHRRVIEVAMERSENILVLVGSSGKARTIRNPFTFEERKAMIYESFNGDLVEGLIIKPLYDKMYNDSAWIKQVQDIVVDTALDIANDGVKFRNHGIGNLKIGLIGADKDHTSYYLKMFPQWGSVGVSLEHAIHATDMRNAYFTGDKSYLKQNLPTNVYNMLHTHGVGIMEVVGFNDTPMYEQLIREFNHANRYKKSWEVAPYPVKHLTVDAVVEQSGHILLVKRKAEPGKGLWALPGGHVEEYEAVELAMLRELREETKIKVPDAVIRGSIHREKMFDDPHRSNIGRVVTMAYHIKLTDDTKLPKVRGADDAEKAAWVPIGMLKEEDFFDDHFHIISYFLGV